MVCFDEKNKYFRINNWIYEVLDYKTVNNQMKREFDEKKEYSSNFFKDLEIKNLIKLVHKE